MSWGRRVDGSGGRSCGMHAGAENSESPCTFSIVKLALSEFLIKLMISKTSPPSFTSLLRYNTSMWGHVCKVHKMRGHHSPYQRYSKYPGIPIIMPGMSIDLEKEVVCEFNWKCETVKCHSVYQRVCFFATDYKLVGVQKITKQSKSNKEQREAKLEREAKRNDDKSKRSNDKRFSSYYPLFNIIDSTTIIQLTNSSTSSMPAIPPTKSNAA